MQALDDGLIEQLLDRVEQALEQLGGQTDEYRLLRTLADIEPHFAADYRDELALFQVHFLLFHLLHRLGRRPRFAARWRLNIESIRIQRLPVADRPPGDTLTEHDPLRDYYLELSNLYRTGRLEVSELLDGFWRRLHAHGQRAQALQTLGLDDAVDGQQVEQQFRRLAMRHHPDRGGDAETFRQIEQARRVLLAC